MRHFPRHWNMARLRKVLALTAALGLWSVPSWGYGPGCSGCWPCLYYPGISALDTPLRAYNMPRCPARGGNDFRYQVEMPTDCQSWGPHRGSAGNEAMIEELPFPAELAGPFAPLKFERLGQIPNDSLLDGSAGGGR